MKQKKQVLIGAHMSITGGLYKALERGSSIGCTTIQIFTKSNRQWGAKELTVDDIKKFKETRDKLKISPIIAHATYLINIGSSDKDVEKKSIIALKNELERCELLGIEYLVLHPGSSGNLDENICLKQISKNLNSILSTYTGKTMILLETMAGQGSTVCYSFEQIAHILNESKYKEKLGVCIDTCHIFAAGYNFDTKENYNNLFNKFDRLIGLKKIKALHINDSKKECASRVDRHENIGEGKITLNGFKFLLNDNRFFDIPKILETPKNDLEDDKKNIEKLYSLLNKKTKEIFKI